MYQPTVSVVNFSLNIEAKSSLHFIRIGTQASLKFPKKYVEFYIFMNNV